MPMNPPPPPPKRRVDLVPTEELLELYPDLAELYNKYLTFEILKRDVPDPDLDSQIQILKNLIDGWP